MGYRSEVAYVINFRDKQKRDEFISLVRVEGGDLLSALRECIVPEYSDDYDGDAQINFYVSDAKWYESYQDVKWHHDLMGKAVAWSNGEGVGVKFVRVGEETGDIVDEEHGDTDYVPYDDFYPVTTIELPFKAYQDTYGDKEKENA